LLRFPISWRVIYLCDVSNFLNFVFTTNSLWYSGHCKKLTPEYAAAAKILGERNPPLYLAKVDATENNALAERFEVKGFPTLHWFV
jgi:protein disulfide-isomerase A4